MDSCRPKTASLTGTGVIINIKKTCDNDDHEDEDAVEIKVAAAAHVVCAACRRAVCPVVGCRRHSPAINQCSIEAAATSSVSLGSRDMILWAQVRRTDDLSMPDDAAL